MPGSVRGGGAFLTLIVGNLDLMGALFQWVSSCARQINCCRCQPTAGRRFYRLSFDLLLIALGVGLWRLLRLRRSTPNAGGGATFGMLGAVITIVVLIHIVPYRLLFQNTVRTGVGRRHPVLLDQRTGP